ncbi:MAG TPA: regulatory protein RecX [bacterium]
MDEAQAYRYALWLLNRRPYSTGEIVEKFRNRNLPSDLQKKVLQRLLDKKFLNDAAFTETFIHSRMGRSWGPFKIRSGLLKKRIPRELGDKTLASVFTRGVETENARELLERQKQRFLRKKEKKPGQNLHRACEFLVRKGYSFPAARLAVREIFGYNSGLLQDEK